MSDGLKLLVSILVNGGVSSLRSLDRELFLDDEVTIYDGIRNHYRSHATLPAVETLEEDFNIRLPDAPEPVSYYEKKVRDRHLYVLLSPEFAELRKELTRRDIDAVDARIATMRRFLRANSIREDSRTMRESLDGVFASYLAAKEHPGVSGIPSGWGSLDRSTGGYQQGDLVSLVGRMGMGKTYLMLRQADVAWKAGYSPLFITMEMTILQIARRFLAFQVEMNPDPIRKGQFSTLLEPQFESRTNRFLRVNHRHLDRFHLYAGGFSKKIGDIEELLQEYNPDIVFIDGAYLLRPDEKRTMGRFERIAEVIDAVKKITITQDRPIVISTQFSRQSGKKGKEGSLENIGFTDAVGMHSSIVLGAKEGKTPYQKTRRSIEIMKGREGESGEFEINFKFGTMDFSEVVPEGDNDEREEGADDRHVPTQADEAALDVTL